jgi:hypothetical protein
MSQQRFNKRESQFAPVAPSDPKRTRNAVQGDSALQFVSMSQTRYRQFEFTSLRRRVFDVENLDLVS